MLPVCFVDFLARRLVGDDFCTVAEFGLCGYACEWNLIYSDPCAGGVVSVSSLAIALVSLWRSLVDLLSCVVVVLGPLSAQFRR